jgi:hypothetical protein
MKNRVNVSLFCAALLMPFSPALAQVCSKKSPSHTVALLELYTSEGCSSCPPADKFVSGLHRGGLQPDQVVPLSLHVDYWDYIGWKDVFAKRLFTERQRWLSDLANTQTIYTPEIFVSGKEVRNWAPARGGVIAAVKRINSQPAQADITITLSKAAHGKLPIEVGARSPRNSKLFVALYENALATKVVVGENGGATLKHDYVVRDWIGPIELKNDKQVANVTLPRALAIPPGAIANNLGVAAFVQTDTGEVLQAVSLSLCTV